MESIADELRHEARHALLALTASERVRLALALGQRDVEAFAKAHEPPLSAVDASRSIERRRQRRRRPSGCIEALLG
jgi:hypothetical protein